jgi:hypothetical protein
MKRSGQVKSFVFILFFALPTTTDSLVRQVGRQPFGGSGRSVQMASSVDRPSLRFRVARLGDCSQLNKST